MTTMRAWMDKTFYPGFRDKWDDKMFRERILPLTGADKMVLDLGAGAGIIKEMDFRRKCGSIFGIDLDPRVENNPYLDEGKIANAENIPYPDSHFDLIFSNNVIEHIADPDKVFSEVCRCLKPGGHFMFKTPNVFHYMPLISRITPHSFHQFVNKLRGRKVVDTFPTCYRANSKKRVSSLAVQCGFKVNRIELIEGRPEYLRINPLLYTAGVAYERLVNATEFLSTFRILLIVDLVKADK